jgi:hypothetical protein
MEDLEKKDEILGEIFNSITYTSSEDLNNLIDNMTQEQLKLFTNLALTSAFQRGSFTIVETEIVSKILTLKSRVTDTQVEIIYSKAQG